MDFGIALFDQSCAWVSQRNPRQTQPVNRNCGLRETCALGLEAGQRETMCDRDSARENLMLHLDPVGLVGVMSECGVASIVTSTRASSRSSGQTRNEAH